VPACHFGVPLIVPTAGDWLLYLCRPPETAKGQYMGVRRVGFRNTVGFRNKGEFHDTVWHPVMHIRALNVIGALRRGQNLLCIQIAQMYLAHGFAVL